MISLEAPQAAAKTVALLEQALTQEEQMGSGALAPPAEEWLDAGGAQSFRQLVRQSRRLQRGATASAAS